MNGSVISVNGSMIAESEIAREMQNHPASSMDEARLAAATALVIRHLLFEQAASAGYLSGDTAAIEPEQEEEAIQLLLSDRVRTPEVDDVACRRYWEANRKRFRSPDLVEARHILLAANPDDPEARTVAKRRGQELIEVLSRDRGGFAALAAEHSACPSKDQGGALGQVSRGETVPELETFLFNLDPGQLCPLPVESRYGFHVVIVDHRVEGRELPYEAVQERVGGLIRQTAWRNGVRQFLQILVGQAKIEGLAVDGASSPLVR